MTPEPPISVAMCAYNSERFIREQLDSLVAQTRRPSELVVCDDASTDGTAEIVNAFARAAPFSVRLFVQPGNVGRIANFQTAISLCTGDIIFLSDADDVWHPEKIEAMSQALASAPDATGVFCDAEIVDAALRPIGRSVWEHCGFTPELQARLRSGAGFEPLLRSQAVQGAALAFRMSCRPLLLPLAPHWGHDSWIAVLLFASGALIALDRKLMAYRQHGANLMGIPARRPSGQQRLARGLRDPKASLRQRLAAAMNDLAQMDELRQRLEAVPAGTRRAQCLTAIAARRRKIERRRRTAAAVLALLGGRAPKSDDGPSP
jgi:glycosyltransferase involved in cell wall biosynthesis